MEQNKETRRSYSLAGFLTQSTCFSVRSKRDINPETNILNYLKCVQIILPKILKIKSGNFIYLSSFRSRVSSRGISLYAASKAFGEMFFETIGKEYGALGIYSSSIRMGYFDGRMTNDLDEDKVKSIKLNAGNRRLGKGTD